jgi:peptide/nickel transport system substrate-binding protein
MTKLSRRTFLGHGVKGAALVVIASSSAEFLAACALAPGAAAPSGPVVKGGHVVEGRIDDVKTFNPLLWNDERSALASSLCFDGLLDLALDGSLVPAIAESLPKVASDGLTYTFALRKDVKWSDGRALTADDVLFTYNLMIDPANKAFNSPFSADLSEFLASVSAPDQYTVVMKTKKVSAPFLAAHGHYGILPKAVLGSVSPADLNSAAFNTAPSVVNGVFKFTSWTRGQQLTLDRNATYYRGPSNIERYVYRLIGDQGSLVPLLKTGEIDFAEIQALQLADVQSDPNLKLASFPGGGFATFVFQLDPARAASQLFSDKNVRQALLLAVNRTQMVQTIYAGQAQVCDSVILPSSWAFNPNVAPKYAYDKARAESMLDTAGWKKNASGLREKGGKQLKFSILSYASRDRRPLEVLQDAWKQIGVTADLRLLETTAVNSANRRSRGLGRVGRKPWLREPAGPRCLDPLPLPQRR